jgi:RNA polymerase sigma-70 factor (ECF subfamily)
MRKRVYSIVRNHEDTEDVVQDSLLKAYRHLQDFRESCEFPTWITRIAINTALMLLRKRRSRAEVSFYQGGETDETWTMWDTPDPAPNTERTYARQEALEFVSRAVSHLPPLLRCALEQYHAQEQSLRESADRLAITVASAKSRLYRARRALRSKLEGQHISFFDACY